MRKLWEVTVQNKNVGWGEYLVVAENANEAADVARNRCKEETDYPDWEVVQVIRKKQKVALCHFSFLSGFSAKYTIYKKIFRNFCSTLLLDKFYKL